MEIGSMLLMLYIVGMLICGIYVNHLRDKYSRYARIWEYTYLTSFFGVLYLYIKEKQGKL